MTKWLILLSLIICIAPVYAVDSLIVNDTAFQYWHITKTGIETSVDVDFTIIDEISTEFCLTFNDLNTLKDYYTLTSKDITKYPITVSESLLTSKNSFDLTKSIVNKNCFIVYYEDFDNNNFIKIGYNSILVLAAKYNAFVDPTYESSFRDSTGQLFVWIRKSDSDLYVYNSTDNVTFTETKAYTGTASGASMLSDSNDIIHIIGEETSGDNHIFWINSTDGGKTYSTPKTILTQVSHNYIYPICVMDSNNIWHCTVSELADDKIVYINYSHMTEVIVNDNVNDDTDRSTIGIFKDNIPYVIGTGTDHDDLDIWSPKLNGWGDANRVQIDAHGSEEYLWADTMYMNNILYVAYTEASTSNDYNVYMAYSEDNGSTWNSHIAVYTDDAFGNRVNLIVDINDNVMITYTNDTYPEDNTIRYSNTTDFGSTLTHNVLATGEDGHNGVSLRGTLFPIFNRPDRTIDVFFANTTGAYYTTVLLPLNQETEPENCWTETSDMLIIPSGCTYGTNTIKGIG